MRRGSYRLLAMPVVALLAGPLVAAGTPPRTPTTGGVGRLAVPAHGSARPTNVGALAAAAYHRMSRKQRIGQLLFVGIDGSGPTEQQLAIVQHNDVGNVFLVKNSDVGVRATRDMVVGSRSAATQAGVRPLVGTDQEGGYVQRLTGPGFSTMPTALQQGQWSTGVLKQRATSWAHQLHRAAVNLNAAPVADVVPARHAHANAPIGHFDREFGHRPGIVASHVTAFVAGMKASGVLAVAKHFPGLGRASGNTDDTSGVTDPTTRHDRYLKPFRAAIDAGVPIVMVSSATYPAIDPNHIAAFSHRIISGMLRGDLGFRGAVVSDSLTTPPLNQLPAATRAVDYLEAGGDLLLLPEAGYTYGMRHGIAQEMAADPAFARRVKAAVLAVLRVKARAGLIFTDTGGRRPAAPTS